VLGRRLTIPYKICAFLFPALKESA
jgi:hypothetical protein